MPRFPGVSASSDHPVCSSAPHSGHARAPRGTSAPQLGHSSGVFTVIFVNPFVLQFNAFLPEATTQSPCAEAAHRYLKARFVRWCNGSTTPFGGVCHGSNPCRTANYRPYRPPLCCAPLLDYSQSSRLRAGILLNSETLCVIRVKP